MTNKTFTRGYWTIHSGARNLEIHPADDEHGEHPIADILTNEADARLIAAAPKLLELLNEAQEYLDILADDAREAGYPVRAENAIQLSKRCRETITEANLIQL